jgi:hypothetical protein
VLGGGTVGASGRGGGQGRGSEGWFEKGRRRVAR